MNLEDPILLALDFGHGHEATLAEARQLASRSGSELTLLHALRVPTMPQFGDDTSGERDRAEGRCRALIASLSAAGVRVSPDPIVAIERPSALVLETLRSRPISIVLLGSGEAITLQKLVSGSTVETLLRDCPRPVWLAYARERSAGIKRLLVAVDTSHAAGEAFKAGLRLAQLFGARLDLLRVFPESTARAASLPKQQEELRAYASRFELGGVEVEYVTWEGSPGERILEATVARRSDLLVLGTAGRRGLYRWLEKPMGERLARQLPCSLLCVPFSRSQES